MNRSTFFKTLAAALASVASGSALASMASSRPLSLIEWLNEIRAGNEKAIVVAGLDTIDYFREEVPKGYRGVAWASSDPQIRFTLEPVPWRYDSIGNLVPPYLNRDTPLGRQSTINPEWVSAPTEIAFAAVGIEVNWAAFDRKTFNLIPFSRERTP